MTPFRKTLFSLAVAGCLLLGSVIVGRSLLQVAKEPRGALVDPIWPAISAPAVQDDTIYFSQRTGTRLVAMEMKTKQVKWVFDGGERSIRTAPLVEAGVPYIWVGPPDSTVYAIDCRDGRPIWDRKVSGWTWKAPISCGPLVLFAAEEMYHKIYAFDKKTRKPAWSKNIHKLQVVHEDRLLCDTENGAKIAVLDSTTGNELASFALRPGVQWVMAACGGEGIAVASCKGVLLAVDMAGLKEVWRKDTGNLWWVPAIDGGEVVLLRGYTGWESRNLRGMPIEIRDLRTGEVKRRAEIPDADVASFTETPAVFFGEKRMVINAGLVLELDRSTLKVEWRYGLNVFGWLPYKDTLFLGGDRMGGPGLHQIDVNTGQVMWEYLGTYEKPLPDGPTTRPGR